MKKKIIVGIVFVLIVVAALIIAGLYIATDTFKSDKEMFFKYLSKTRVLDESFVEKYKEVIKTETQSNYSSSGNITYSTVSGENETSVANVNQLFNIKYNSLKNKDLNQHYADFTLNSNNEDIATIRYLRDNNVYGIKIENVLKKYIAIENNNLKDFYAKLGIQDSENLPNAIATTSIESLLNINENQLDTIKTTYGNILINNLTKKNFIKSKNGTNVTIKMSLTEREFANILKQELETLKTDGNTLNFIIDKANASGYTLDVETLTKYIQEQIDSINNNTNITDEEFISIAITENNKNVEKIDIILNYIVNGNNGDMTSVKKESYSLSIDMSQNNKTTIIVNDSNNISKIDMSYGNDETKIWENIDVNLIESETNNSKNICKIKHQINYTNNNIIQDITISINSEEDKYISQININDSKELKQDIQIEKITDQNAEILNGKTRQEIQNLLNAIIQRIQFVYGNKLEYYASLFEGTK